MDTEGESHSEEELRLLLAQSAKSGDEHAIQTTEHELIEKVFHFDERLVRQIMVPRTRMSMFEVEMTTEEILNALVKEGYSRMPVYSKSRDNIVGIAHAKDILRMERQTKEIKLRDLMRPPYFVPETKKINELLREFQRRRIHIAIVVDEFGVTSGLVTLEDIVEELVGEIQDEYDEEVPVAEQRAENEFVVKGFASIIDVNKVLPIPLPESNDYATVAGLINMIFGFIPEVNQKMTYGSYEFTILKRARRSVDSALIRLLPPEQEDDGGTETPEVKSAEERD
jgi:CBS domain containing-hemolysin-like protein